MKKDYAEFLLEKTKEDYNLISEEFARTRAFPSEDIKALADYSRLGEKILDFGCGSGRLFAALKDRGIEYFGADVSPKQIEIAKRTYPEADFRITSGLVLDFPENFFDKVYAIAVLHHLPSLELRLQLLKELKRVLKPAGQLFLRVWDIWPDRKKRKLFWQFAFLKLIGKSKLDFGDIFMPWKDSQGKVLAERYYHCFTKRELKRLARQAGFKIVKSWPAGEKEKANLYLIAEK